MSDAQDLNRGPSIDLPELLSRVDNDHELLRDLLTIFKEDFPRHLQALHEAVAAQDMKQTSVVSHTLKGMLLSMSVTRAAAAAGQLEKLAHDGTKPSVQEALVAFEMEVQGLLPEMDSCVAAVSH